MPTALLYDAFDKLVGRSRWRKRPNVGNFVVRFPSEADPGDLGWHIDLSFPGETGDPEGRDYSAWRVNVTSKDRALLLLFLFSDVGEDDAPTRIPPHPWYPPPSAGNAMRSHWRETRASGISAA